MGPRVGVDPIRRKKNNIVIVIVTISVAVIAIIDMFVSVLVVLGPRRGVTETRAPKRSARRGEGSPPQQWMCPLDYYLVFSGSGP